MKSSPGSAQSTDSELLALWAGESCPACGKFKQAGRPFCETDYRAVTLFLRGQLLDLKSAAIPYYRTALQHLLDFGPQRRLIMSQNVGRGVRWPYSSDADLESAGFIFSSHAVCRVPGCSAAIVWWRTPRGKHLAVNFPDVARGPHYATCKDPDYFTRRRERLAAEKKQKRALQAIARRRKRSA